MIVIVFQFVNIVTVTDNIDVPNPPVMNIYGPGKCIQD
jgi:hypothetical protein